MEGRWWNFQFRETLIRHGRVIVLACMQDELFDLLASVPTIVDSPTDGSGLDEL